MISGGSGDQRPIAEINITPLVDVMLVLLVIFMVTVPLMENGIPVELPKAATKALPQEENPVTLYLTRSSQMFVNKEAVRPDTLTSHLQNYFKTRQNKEVFIRADGSLPYSFVAQAMAAVKNAGVFKIGLVTLPEQENRPEDEPPAPFRKLK